MYNKSTLNLIVQSFLLYSLLEGIQNHLEYRINYLTNYEMNVTVIESRMRNADIARKSQIAFANTFVIVS